MNGCGGTVLTSVDKNKIVYILQVTNLHELLLYIL